MASLPIHIEDFAAALADGTIPGGFVASSSAHPVFEFPAVRSASSRGAHLVWHIRVSAQDAQGNQVQLRDAWLKPGASTPAGVVGVIETESYQISESGVRGRSRAGGKPTSVWAGKNLGKANATNPVTQALRDALGRYNAQAKRASLQVAPAAAAPAARCEKPPPMLVKKHGETREATLTPKDFEQGVTVQRKFNGVRVVMFLGGPPGGEATAMYSRTKGHYPGFAEIRGEALACVLLDAPAVPDDLLQPPFPERGQRRLNAAELDRLRRIYAEDRPHLDGEIYLHGKPLSWISGQARKEEDEGALNYMVFDCFFPAAKAAGHDMASAERQKYLDLLFAEAARRHESDPNGCRLARIKRVENFSATSVADVEALRARFLDEGYEGAIARKNRAGYQYSYNSYHSASLVKFKPLFDDEFEVVGYAEGKKGKDVGAVIWICEVDPARVQNPSDKTFRVVPKDMSYEERYQVFRCLGEEVDNSPAAVAAGGPPRLTRFNRDFRGKPLTVEYPERSTKTGKPVQAKALTFRTYEGDLAADPLRRLYTECAQ